MEKRKNGEMGMKDFFAKFENGDGEADGDGNFSPRMYPCNACMYRARIWWWVWKRVSSDRRVFLIVDGGF